MSFPTRRLRRLRAKPSLRRLARETRLSLSDFILPLFIRHGHETRDINSMPGHKQWCLADLPTEINALYALGIQQVLLFGIPEHKDELGSDSYHEQGIIQQAIRLIKEHQPSMLVIADVCFCEYTSHGHCGVVNDKCGQLDVDNDETLLLLQKQALSFAQAGADIIAPSGNMDGMVGAIRAVLDEKGFVHTPILSYSAKYASSFYGPFREAAEGAPKFGDRKTYQMDPANGNEALKETLLDVEEGADMLMVKPALAYLDVIYRIKEAFPEFPLVAYQVSGEFSMIKAAAEKGWIDEKKVALESLIAIKRAGADIIVSYFTKQIAAWLKEEGEK
ncbi:MAG: porphobilinogen synthase [Gammaproteobacteria bacterium]|nr:porphobilinogen synthase [Gammaproteobacteria bacterium]